jgi:hypothetical protein
MDGWMDGLMDTDAIQRHFELETGGNKVSG